MSPALFSSKRSDWETPDHVFAALNEEFHFDLDVCALPSNTKCGRFFTPEADGLAQPWAGICWMNPPYGRDIGRWMRKAFDSARTGATVVCLVPARTDTSWWHDFCARAEVRFIRGRLRFLGARSSAPFPSAIVIFRPGPASTTEGAAA